MGKEMKSDLIETALDLGFIIVIALTLYIDKFTLQYQACCILF